MQSSDSDDVSVRYRNAPETVDTIFAAFQDLTATIQAIEMRDNRNTMSLTVIGFDNVRALRRVA